MKKRIIDVSERALATFAQAFLAVTVVSGATDLTALKIAGTAGAFALAKYLLVVANSYLGNPPPVPKSK